MKKLILLLFFTSILLACKGKTEVDKEKPVFKGKNRGSVLLRYNYGQGRTDRYKMISDIKMRMSVMGRDIKIPMKMSMGYDMAGSAKNSDGNYDIVMSIKSFVIDAPKQGIRYDSGDKKSTFAGAAAINQILGKPFRMTISPRGKTIKADMDGMLAGISGNKMIRKIVTDMIESMKRTGMGQFPEQPVKAGDRFKAMEYSQNLQGMMKMDVALSYTVESISADGKKVVLKPDMKMKFAANSGKMKIKVSDMKIDGWMLFHTDTGRVERSKMKISMDLSIQVMGQTADATMDMLTDLKLQ